MLLIRITFLLILLFSPQPPLELEGQSTDIPSLLAELKDAGEEPTKDQFTALTSIGGQKAFDALKKSTSFFEELQTLYSAYGAFADFAEDPLLLKQSLKFLEQEAFKDRRENAQIAATWSLSYFDGAGDAALERIVAKHKNDTCRTFAVAFLLEKLGARADASSARMILDNAGLRDDGLQERVFEALRQCRDSKSKKLMMVKFLDDETSEDWSLVLLRLLAEDSRPLVTRALIRRLGEEGRHHKVLAKIMAELGRRRAENARSSIKPFLISEDPVLRCAAVLATSRIVGPDRIWVQKLVAYGKDGDPLMRQVAAKALVELRVGDAFELLSRLLEDPDLRARSLAVELLAETRDPRTVPLFINCLRTEHGALSLRIARVLRLLTGEDFGFGPSRWSAWWTGEGATFEFPSEEEALELEYARRKRRASSGKTQTVFYGLPVQSKNVCFLLDTSGSMLELVTKTSVTAGGDSTAKGPTRLELAKEKLTRVINSLHEGTYCNIVFFSTDASSWEGRAVALDPETKKQALEYVESGTATGSTNVYSGLTRAFRDERIDTIYMLTDGEPTSGKVKDRTRLRAMVAEWNELRHVQIHCISVGRESEFLRALAADTGGDFRVVD